MNGESELVSWGFRLLWMFSVFFFLISQNLVLGKKLELCEGSFLPKIQLKKRLMLQLGFF